VALRVGKPPGATLVLQSRALAKRAVASFEGDVVRRLCKVNSGSICTGEGKAGFMTERATARAVDADSSLAGKY